jgi:hypothetical protein
MNITEALNLLRHYQLWRLGEEITELNPKQITEAINVVISGAKWQQDKMYSEEEVLKLLIAFSDERTFLKEDVAIQWFDKNKKQ